MNGFEEDIASLRTRHLRIPRKGYTFFATQPLLSDPGTYSIAGWAEEGRVNVEVYASDNMSVPLNAYQGETREIPFPTENTRGVPITDESGERALEFPTQNTQAQTAKVIASPDKPIFIKVTMPEENTGRYSLGIHKHAGGFKEDAIILFPALEHTVEFGEVPTTSLARWFRFDTDGALSGEAQTLAFSASASSDAPVASFLVNPDNSVAATFEDSRFQRQEAEDNFRTYYWVAEPEQFEPNLELQVGWETNLQVLIMQAHTNENSVLTATNETGWGFFGSDDNVRMNLFADGVQLFSQPNACEDATPDCVATTVDDRPNFGDFDTGTVKQVDPRLTCSVGFLDSLRVEISEEEGVRNDQVMTGIIADGMLLAPNESERGAQTILLSSDAGEYRLKFYLKHSTQGQARRASRGSYKPTFREPVSSGGRLTDCG